MRPFERLALILGGLLLMAAGLAALRADHFAFTNASYHQTVFAAAGFGTGILLCLLACLPSSTWVYERITTRRRTPRIKLPQSKPHRHR